jgi:hypothetical protein
MLRMLLIYRKLLQSVELPIITSRVQIHRRFPVLGTTILAQRSGTRSRQINLENLPGQLNARLSIRMKQR